MPKVILNETEVTYQIKKSARSKRLSIRINQPNRIIVTLPKYATDQQALDFINQKSDWIIEHLSSNTKNFHPDISQRDPLHYKKFKEEARVIIMDKVKFWNQYYKFSYNKIYIKNTTSRWGSCSRLRNLNFNYKIIFLPESQQDYIIVHELCHLEEMNHGVGFWSQVAKTIPNYAEQRKALQRWVL